MTRQQRCVNGEPRSMQPWREIRERLRRVPESVEEQNSAIAGCFELYLLAAATHHTARCVRRGLSPCAPPPPAAARRACRA